MANQSQQSDAGNQAARAIAQALQGKRLQDAAKTFEGQVHVVMHIHAGTVRKVDALALVASVQV